MAYLFKSENYDQRTKYWISMLGTGEWHNEYHRQNTYKWLIPERELVAGTFYLYDFCYNRFFKIGEFLPEDRYKFYVIVDGYHQLSYDANEPQVGWFISNKDLAVIKCYKDCLFRPKFMKDKLNGYLNERQFKLEDRHIKEISSNNFAHQYDYIIAGVKILSSNQVLFKSQTIMLPFELGKIKIKSNISLSSCAPTHLSYEYSPTPYESSRHYQDRLSLLTAEKNEQDLRMAQLEEKFSRLMDTLESSSSKKPVIQSSEKYDRSKDWADYTSEKSSYYDDEEYKPNSQYDSNSNSDIIVGQGIIEESSSQIFNNPINEKNKRKKKIKKDRNNQ